MKVQRNRVLLLTASKGSIATILVKVIYFLLGTGKYQYFFTVVIYTLGWMLLLYL